MNPDQRVLAIGAYLNGALYLIGIFVASLFVQHNFAWKLAVAAAGVSFLSYVAQVRAPPHADMFVRKALVACSNILGLGAGLFVVFGG